MTMDKDLMCQQLINEYQYDFNGFKKAALAAGLTENEAVTWYNTDMGLVESAGHNKTRLGAYGLYLGLTLFLVGVVMLSILWLIVPTVCNTVGC